MAIKTCNPSGMGWEQFSAGGSEEAQLRVWAGLSVRQKLEALEEMGEMAERVIAHRKRHGLPYFDPDTGELVHPGRQENA